MQNIFYNRLLSRQLEAALKNRFSILLFGPRQTGKTTLIKDLTKTFNGVLSFPLQNPAVRLELESDPSKIIRQIEVNKEFPLVFIDEVQKIPPILDAIQYLIDEKKAHFILTGSSSRKLKQEGTNLLPGRVKTMRLTPILWNEFGWLEESILKLWGNLENINQIENYSFEKSMIFGSLPVIVNKKNDSDKKDFLKSYSQIYIEEEIRAEAITRKLGAFNRFIELAALESGTAPNFTKLSMNAGVSVPTIKEYYSILEDTLIIERLDPFIKNARQRLLKAPKFYFFDIGVRNSLARLPLTDELINLDKGILFEHAVILEIIHRIRTLNLDYKVYYWRTSYGAEVDCVIDTGSKLIHIEIKAMNRVKFSDLHGLSIFLKNYSTEQGYVIYQGKKPEKITDQIIAVPWNFL